MIKCDFISRMMTTHNDEREPCHESEKRLKISDAVAGSIPAVGGLSPL